MCALELMGEKGKGRARRGACKELQRQSVCVCECVRDRVSKWASEYVCVRQRRAKVTIYVCQVQWGLVRLGV